jgi:carbonic anhydrase
MSADDVSATFSDVTTANRAYADAFTLGGLSPQAARGLAIVTCIDTRIDPLAALGLRPGDAKILRNAGARATPDAVRSLVLATHLLSVSRVLVMPHTRCAAASADDAETRRTIEEKSGLDLGDYPVHTTSDQLAALRGDLKILRDAPFLAPGVEIAGAVYDVDTGLLGPLVT